MVAKVSLRERHAVETRQRIVDVALALFIEQGYEATTTDEIAEQADVSPRTFFRYFVTKEALLFHDFEERLAKLKDHIGERPPGEPPAKTLVLVLRRIIAELEATTDMHRLTAQLLKERPSLRSYQRATIAEHAEKEITAALAKHVGCPSHDLSLRVLVATVAACFDIAVQDWIDSNGSLDESFTRTMAAGGAVFPRQAL